MELESVGPRRTGRLGRVRSWSAVLGPVVALALVTAVGAFGGSGGPDRPQTATRPSLEPAGDGPTATPAPQGSTRPTPEPTQVAVPRTIHGLDVLDVPGARRAGLGEPGPDQLVAVEGWLSIAPGDPRCESPRPLACGRSGLLGISRALDGAALLVESQPGVPLLGLQRQSPSIGTWTLPNRAIVIGRFVRVEQQGCVGPPRCGPVLQIERLAWLRTAARPAPVLMGPGAIHATWTAGAAERAGRGAIDDVGPTLLTSVSDRSTLRVIDPAAAEAVATLPPDTPLWYVRTIAWGGGIDGERAAVVGWSVIDDRTHAVLAVGVWSDSPVVDPA